MKQTKTLAAIAADIENGNNLHEYSGQDGANIKAGNFESFADFMHYYRQHYRPLLEAIRNGDTLDEKQRHTLNFMADDLIKLFWEEDESDTDEPEDTESDEPTESEKAVITMVGNKSVEPEKTATDEIEVLFAVDTEDNVKTSLLAVRANDRQNNDKTAAIEQALTEMLTPDEWDDPDEVRADIRQAAEQLAAGWDTKVLEGYDYEVFWDTVKMA